jgi:hypothetical protein
VLAFTALISRVSKTRGLLLAGQFDCDMDRRHLMAPVLAEVVSTGPAGQNQLSMKPPLPRADAIGSSSFVPNNGVILHDDAVALVQRLMKERGLEVMIRMGSRNVCSQNRGRP